MRILSSDMSKYTRGMVLVAGAEEIGIGSETRISEFRDSETKGAEAGMDFDMGVSEYGGMMTGGSEEIGTG